LRKKLLTSVDLLAKDEIIKDLRAENERLVDENKKLKNVKKLYNVNCVETNVNCVEAMLEAMSN
jgi:hypothetical protein